MKMTTLVLIIVLAHTGSAGYGQITLREKNASLEKVLAAIEKQTNYVFLYDPDDLKMGPITIAIKNTTLQETLEKVFKGLPIEFTVVGNNVLIKKKRSENVKKAMITDISIPGKVVDENGQPLPGVTVVNKRENKGTATDTSGSFVLSGTKGDILRFSFVGYKEKEISIGDPGYIRDGVSFVYVLLEPGDGKLDEVQTIAYGKVSNRFNTGNVTTVKGSDLAMQPVGNPLLALQGLVPGLAITQLTGAAGGGVNVQLRGQSSIQSESDPLYVIDGIPYVLRSGGSLLRHFNPNLSGGSMLNMINPSDIESIDVLKDADATAIYGSQGANGVVLITTKKGRPGPARFTLDVYSGRGSATRSPHYLGLSPYLSMRHEALQNDQASVSATDYDINGTWDTTRYTNWSKVLMGQMVRTNDLQAQFTGGNNNIQYFAGGGFHNESTVYPGNGGDKKGSVHLNVNAATSDKKLELRLTGSWLSAANTVQPAQVTTLTAMAADAPAAYKPDGSLNWQDQTYNNPLAPLTAQYNNHSHTVLTSALLIFHAIKGLDLKANVGYNDLYDREFQGTPATLMDPWIFAYVDPSNYRYGAFYHDDCRSWVIEPQASFTRPLAKGVLTALAGASYRHTTEKSAGSFGEGFPSDSVLSDLSKAATVVPLSMQKDDYKYNALFGRLNYNWKNKYIVSFNGRYDGSSRFGPDRQFHLFSSLAGVWIFSAEPFFQQRLSWLSFGKLRASYGATGNDGVQGFTYQGVYDSTLYSYQGRYGLYPSGPADPDFSWESTRKMEIGLDLGFGKDRFLLNLNYYRFRSSNLQLGSQLSIVTGFGGVTQNLPVVIGNQGLELSLQTTNIKKDHFLWTTSATLTIPRNKLIRLDNLDQTAEAGAVIIGYPLNIRKVFRSSGVDPQTGLYRFIDSSGKYTSRPQFGRDETAIVRMDPSLYGSVSNRLQYKSITLEVLIFFTRQVNINPNLTSNLPPGSEGNNVLVHTADARWRYPGQTAAVQRYGNGADALISYFRAAYSDLNYSNAAYIRCKNIYLAYQFPTTIIKKFHMNNFTFYIKGQNLFTISSYKDLDPETGTQIAPVRLVAAGIKAGF